MVEPMALMDVDVDAVAEAHLDAYGKFYKACLGKLGSIWRQIGHGAIRSDEIGLATDEALAAWSKAVARAEAERQSLKALIQQQSAEIANIRQDLDDGVESSSEASATPLEGEATLLRTLEALKGTLQLWRTKRAARVQAYEALMATHVALKKQLGMLHAPAEDVDISTGALDYLQMENGKLEEEKARRLSRAEDGLQQLRAICSSLGEDSGAAAADAHPALRSLSSEKESAEMLGAVLQLSGSHSYADTLGDLDLSDATFDRLAAKIGEMERLKVEREAQSRDVLEMLDSLWTALSIPEDAPERGMVHKLLSSERAQRLHKRTLDKCMAEVNRLEGCKAQAMRDLAMSKARELEQLCIATRISPPHTGPLLAELDKQGQMTQVLSKLVRLVAEVQAMATKRAPILNLVQELLQAQADSAWLRAYNADDNRYKGRDASRNMNRAIKANKLRERLGPMMETLLEALADWELEEGGPFLYDEQVLQDTQLRAVEAELEQVATEKAPRPKQAAAAAAGSASKPPLSKSMHGAGPPPSHRGPTTSSSSFSRGQPAASTSSADRPMLTPRGYGEEVRPRRASMAPSSSRESSIYRPAPSSASKLARSNDFTPGALRAAAAAPALAALAPEPSTSSFRRSQPGGMPPPILTPPMRMSAPGASPMGRAGAGACEGGSGAGGVRASDGGGGGGGFKNSARDLFQRYLGDASNGGSSTPSKNRTTTPAAAAASPVLVAAASPIIARASKLAFSTAFNPVDDDGGNDILPVMGDTPKSTATSRQHQQLQQSIKSPTVSTAQAGGALLSPASKLSRIPKLRL